MLKQRVITALVLLSILVPAVFYQDTRVFLSISVVLVAAGAWEWGKLNQCGPMGSVATGLICAAVCVLSWYAGVLKLQLQSVWLIGGGVWVIVGAWLLNGGVLAWTRLPKALRLVGGVGALWVAWLAVSKARTLGINFLFSILVLVWVADISAYFAGRALGGRVFSRKLAPTISPGKTWEGAIGGLIGVVACAFFWRAMDSAAGTGSSSIYTRTADVHVAFMMLSVLFLAMMSIVGDLVESLFKRSAGVKDSSGLLPGHGGVLDRLDALLPVLPIALFLATV
jgi:phosphatidate cytidylyltransferase